MKMTVLALSASLGLCPIGKHHDPTSLIINVLTGMLYPRGPALFVFAFGLCPGRRP
jgi:hypothetical protein